MSGYEIRVVRDVEAVLSLNGHLVDVVPYKDMLKLVSEYFDDYELELAWSNLAGDVVVYDIKEPIERHR